MPLSLTAAALDINPDPPSAREGRLVPPLPGEEQRDPTVFPNPGSISRLITASVVASIALGRAARAASVTSGSSMACSAT